MHRFVARRRSGKRGRSCGLSAAQIIAAILSEAGCAVEFEFKFDSGRRWRFDIAIPECKIAIEIEGGIWIGGRHVRGSGFVRDIEKYNAAALAGWRVLRTTTAPDSYIKVAQQATALARKLRAPRMHIDTIREALRAGSRMRARRRSAR